MPWAVGEPASAPLSQGISNYLLFPALRSIIHVKLAEGIMGDEVKTSDIPTIKVRARYGISTSLDHWRILRCKHSFRELVRAYDSLINVKVLFVSQSNLQTENTMLPQ